MQNREFSVSLGGSLIIPEHEVRTDYIKLFGVLLCERIDTHRQKTAIVTGGGKPTRVYQHALRKFGIDDLYILDTMGIYATHMNAYLLTQALQTSGVATQYLQSYEEDADLTCDAWVTGGDHPGQTTDAVMVDWAARLGIQTVINATNTPYIYEQNPDGTLNKQRPISEMSWHDYQSMLHGIGHTPGESLPFGFTAMEKAMARDMTAVVVDGNDLLNLGRVFDHKDIFFGTIIHP